MNRYDSEYSGTLPRNRRALLKVGRDEAKRIGQWAYWPDAKCVHGHWTWRSTTSKQCLHCATRNYANTCIRARQREGLTSVMLQIDDLKIDLALARALKEPWDA